MNHKKVKKQINKINSFFDSITADEEISQIEKDLLLSYVRKLYESILSSEEATAPKPKKVSKQSVSKKTTKRITRVAPEPVVETVIERKPFEREPEVITVEEPTTVAPAAAPIASQPEVAIVDAEPAPVLSENMEMIFTKPSSKEISDKLSNLPIKDLTKSMGINERMFTVKELFGGDQKLFTSVMKHLNGLDDFDEAKSYLIQGVASEMKWDDANKYKKAVNFVKLVQRRYS